MALLIEFVSQQWALVGALVVVLLMLFRHEGNRSGPSLSAQQAINKINQQQAVVVDLRDAAEFKSGHIVDALNIPHAKLAERVDELEKYRERPLILVCKMGQHTGAAGKLLGSKGFADVYRLSGGISEWQQQQLPLVK